MIPLIGRVNPFRKDNDEYHLITSAAGVQIIDIWKISLSNPKLLYNKPDGVITLTKEIFDALFLTYDSLLILLGSKFHQLSYIKTYIRGNEFIKEQTLEERKELSIEDTNDNRNLYTAKMEIFDHINVKLPQIFITNPATIEPTALPSFPIQLSEPSSDQPLQPVVESIDTILLQSIRSNNIQLLKTILSSSSEQIIKRSIEKLPKNMVLNFLNMALSSYYKDKEISISWIRLLLSYHMGYLLTVPGLTDIISPFMMMIKNQYRYYNEFVNLENRLELLEVLGKNTSNFLGRNVSNGKALNVYKDDGEKFERLEDGVVEIENDENEQESIEGESDNEMVIQQPEEELAFYE